MPNIKEYDTTPANNTSYFPEGMDRKVLNNRARDVQADVRGTLEQLPWFEFSDGVTYVSATSFSVAGRDLTTLLAVGRRVRASGSSTGTITGRISSSSFSTNTTVVVEWDSGALVNEALTCLVGVGDVEDVTLNPLRSMNNATADKTVTAAMLGAIVQVDASATPVGSPALNIIGATQANPVVLEVTAHGLTAGTRQYITGVLGMTELNGNIYVIDVVDVDHVSLRGIDGTNFTAYTSNGTIAPAAQMQIKRPDPDDISAGYFFGVRKTDAVDTWIEMIRNDVADTDNVEGSETYLIRQQYETVWFMWDGTNWMIYGGSSRYYPDSSIPGRALEDGAVEEAKVGDNAISLAKLKHGAGGSRKFYSQNAAGVPELSGSLGDNIAVKVSQIAYGSAIKPSVFAAAQIFLLETGEIYGVGLGTNSGNGNPLAGTLTVPRKIQIPNGVNPVKLYKGYYTIFFIDDLGEVYAMGINSQGQLGLGDTTARTKFEKITAFGSVKITDVAVGPADDGTYNVTMFLDENGEVWTCGSNQYGALGQGPTPADNTTATKISGLTGVAEIQVSSSYYQTCVARLTDGTVRLWGNNDYGQIGDGTTVDKDVPTNPGLANVSKIICSGGFTSSANGSFSMALTTSGALYSCGENFAGQLGLGDTTDRTSFTQITFTPSATISDFAITAGLYGISWAIDTTGNLWTWGYNNYGACGDGLAANLTSPFKNSESWQGSVTKLWLGGDDSYGHGIVEAGGRYYGAGYSGVGQLGTGVAVAANPNWDEVLVDGNISQISFCGQGVNSATYARFSDGRCAAVGHGAHGQLGLGDAVNTAWFSAINTFVQRAVDLIIEDAGAAWASSTVYDYGVGINHNGAYWWCKLAHTAAAVNEPGTGANHTTYWVKVADTRHMGNFTVAGLPSASANTGHIAYASDETGGAVIVFSDGTNWRRVTDRAIAS